MREKRSDEAMKELAAAKDLDPSDPTPYQYSAILLQNENRPVEALDDLVASMERNDNRAVYRSGYLLDQDRAVRGADLARIYNDLGFEDAGIVAARRSADEDHANHSSHLLLSGVYRNLPGFAPAFLSEVLQARIYQPVGTNAARPDVVNASASFNEYTALFERPRVRAFGSAAYGDTDTDLYAFDTGDDCGGYPLLQAPRERFQHDHRGRGDRDVERRSLRRGALLFDLLGRRLPPERRRGHRGLPKASMPLHGGSACEVRGKICVMGGAGGEPGYSDMATNEVYDPLTDTWEQRSPVPTPRGFLASAVVNDTIYVIGGGYPTAKDVVEAYDPATDTWTTKAKMLQPRIGMAAAVVNGIVYIMGGNYSQRNCQAYDPSTNTWEERAPIPVGGGGWVHSATAYNGLIYVFGGSTYSPWAPLKTVYAYDPQTDTWAQKKDIPTPRFAVGTYLVDGRIYVMGGSQGSNSTAW